MGTIIAAISSARRAQEKGLEDLGELKEKVSILDMSEEERDSLRGEMIGELLIIVDKVLVDVCGTEEALARLLPRAIATGNALAGEMGGFLVGEGMCAQGHGSLLDFAVLHETDGRVDI